MNVTATVSLRIVVMWDAISSTMHKHYKLQSHGPDVISDTEVETGFDNESDYLV